MISIPVELKDVGYLIDVEENSLERVGVALASLGNVSRVLLVSDETVDSLYGDDVAKSIVNRGLDLDVIVVPAGEESKSIDVAFSIWERFLEIGADRRSVAVALGGGVVGDLTGFVAATYQRGIRFFQVPTSLLAQVDSSVGGKTAINLPKGKNMVGAFYQPCGVLIDPTVLSSLSNEQYRSGLGEVVKYGVSLDDAFFVTLEGNVEKIKARDPSILGEIIARCCGIKAQIVSEDEKETTGRRALLNYGHTLGHALETALGYGTLPHGYGVSIGSILVARLALRLAQKGDTRFAEIDEGWIERQINLVRAMGLPANLADVGRAYADAPETEPENIVALAASDKKAEFGMLNFVLPVKLGECIYVKNVSAEDVLATLN